LALIRTGDIGLPAATTATTVTETQTVVADQPTLVADEPTPFFSPAPYPPSTDVPASVPGPSVYNPLPEDPWGGSVCPYFPQNSEINWWTQVADVIALGTVMDVQSPRWTTPDGTRPANPHIVNETIYSPVVIEVEEYLKGEQPTQRLGVLAHGGKIAQDSLDMCRDQRYTFVQGNESLCSYQHQRGTLHMTIFYCGK
jgi:hypothetical protein